MLLQQKMINRYLNTVKKLLFYLFLTSLLVIQIFPIIWLLNFSLLRNGDLFGSHLLKIPIPPQWINYVKAWTQGNIPVYFLNSTIIVFFSVLGTVVVSFMAAYACARLYWKLSGFVFAFILLGMTVPIHTTLLPNFIWFGFFNIINTRTGVIIAYIAFGISFSTLVFSGFLRGIPRAMEESAFIDGAGLAKILFKIIAPMSQTPLVTVSIISFLTNWNEFIMANTFIASERLRTLPFSIINFEGQYSSQYAAQFAVMMLIALPPIVLFGIFNKQIMAGALAGSVKG